MTGTEQKNAQQDVTQLTGKMTNTGTGGVNVKQSAKNLEDFFSSRQKKAAEVTPPKKKKSKNIFKRAAKKIKNLLSSKDSKKDKTIENQEPAAKGGNPTSKKQAPPLPPRSLPPRNSKSGVSLTSSKSASGGVSQEELLSAIRNKVNSQSSPSSSGAVTPTNSRVSAASEPSIDKQSVNVSQNIDVADNDDGSGIVKTLEGMGIKYKEISSFIKNSKSSKKPKLLPIEKLKMVYGKNGGLRQICMLDGNGLYKTSCMEIVTNYKDLKVETAVTALKNSKVDFKKIDDDHKEYFKELLGKVEKYIQNGELEKGTSAEAIVDLCKGLAKDLGISNDSIEKTFGDVKGSTTGSATDAELDKLQKKLGKVGNLDSGVKKLADEVLRFTKKRTDKKFKDQKDYTKKYSEFVSNSGRIAVDYLKCAEVQQNIMPMLINDSAKDVKGKRHVIGSYKIIFMCLVAVCSWDSNHIKFGKEFFKKNIKVFDHFIKGKK